MQSWHKALWSRAISVQVFDDIIESIDLIYRNEKHIFRALDIWYDYMDEYRISSNKDPRYVEFRNNQ